MGSFNTSCFATHQTIAPGDRCRVALIYQQSSFEPVAMSIGGKSVERYGISETSCYADAFWTPATLFIPATYEDYGRVIPDFSDTFSRKSFIDWLTLLRQDEIKVNLGKNTSHDIDFDLEAFLQQQTIFLKKLTDKKIKKALRSKGIDETLLDNELQCCWAYLAERMHEHRLFQLSSGNPRPVQLAILHEHAYNALARSIESKTNWNGDSLERKSLFVKLISDAKSKVLDSVDLKEFLKLQDDTKSNESKGRSLDSIMMSFEFNSLILFALRGIMGNEVAPITRPLDDNQESLDALIKGDLSAEDYFKKIEPIIDQAYAIGGMNGLSLCIAPMIYSDQDYDNSIGHQYRNLLNEVEDAVSSDRCDERMGKYILKDATKDRIEALQSSLGAREETLNRMSIKLNGFTPVLTFWCDMQPNNLKCAIEETCNEDVASDLIVNIEFNNQSLAKERNQKFRI